MNLIDRIKTHLLTFSPQELKRFKKHISVQTHSLHAINIIECFEKYGAKTNKENLHQYLYPNTPYNDVNIRKTLSNFYPLLQEFLLTQANSIDAKKIKTLQYIKSKNRDIDFDKTINLMFPSELMDEKINIDLHLIQSMEIMESIEKKNIRTAEPNLQAVLNALDQKYLLDKLKITCSALNFSLINTHQYHFGLLESMDEYLKQNIDLSFPIIYLYYHTYLFLKENKNDSFEKVFDYLSTNKITRSEESIHLFTMSINYCIRLINKGDRSQMKTLFRLYQKQIESGCVYDSFDKISPHTFKNTLNIALSLKEFEWTKSFIESNKTHLPSTSQEEDYLFAKARLSFEQKNYGDCIQMIMQSKAIDPLNNLSMRVLQIKALYLLDDPEGVDLNIQNAKLYLLRLKSKAYQMSIFKNFFTIMQKINNAPKIDHSFSDKINTELDSKPVAEKNWLKEIIR